STTTVSTYGFRARGLRPRRPMTEQSVSDVEQRLKRDHDGRARHQAPQSCDCHGYDDEFDAAALDAAAVQRVAHDQERGGEDEQWNRGKAHHHGPRFEQAETWEMHPKKPIAAGAQSGHRKTDGDCENYLDGIGRNRRLHDFEHSNVPDFPQTS